MTTPRRTSLTRSTRRTKAPGERPKPTAPQPVAVTTTTRTPVKRSTTPPSGSGTRQGITRSVIAKAPNPPKARAGAIERTKPVAKPTTPIRGSKTQRHR